MKHQRQVKQTSSKFDDYGDRASKVEKQWHRRRLKQREQQQHGKQAEWRQIIELWTISGHNDQQDSKSARQSRPGHNQQKTQHAQRTTQTHIELPNGQQQSKALWESSTATKIQLAANQSKARTSVTITEQHQQTERPTQWLLQVTTTNHNLTTNYANEVTAVKLWNNSNRTRTSNRQESDTVTRVQDFQYENDNNIYYG